MARAKAFTRGSVCYAKKPRGSKYRFAEDIDYRRCTLNCLVHVIPLKLEAL